MAFRNVAQTLRRARPAKEVESSPVVNLYRQTIRSLPKVLTIYDINIDPEKARKVVRAMFDANKKIKDPRMLDVLISKGNMDLEETLLQWKSRNHVMNILFPELTMGEAGRRKMEIMNSKDNYAVPPLEKHFRYEAMWSAAKKGKGFSDEAVAEEIKALLETGEICDNREFMYDFFYGEGSLEM